MTRQLRTLPEIWIFQDKWKNHHHEEELLLVILDFIRKGLLSTSWSRLKPIQRRTKNQIKQELCWTKVDWAEKRKNSKLMKEKSRFNRMFCLLAKHKTVKQLTRASCAADFTKTLPIWRYRARWASCNRPKMAVKILKMMNFSLLCVQSEQTPPRRPLEVFPQNLASHRGFKLVKIYRLCTRSTNQKSENLNFKISPHSKIPGWLSSPFQRFKLLNEAIKSKPRLVTLRKILCFVIQQASGTKVNSIKMHSYQTRPYQILRMLAAPCVLIQAKHSRKTVQNSTFHT